MRRLDWVLIAVIGLFLVSAAAIEMRMLPLAGDGVRGPMVRAGETLATRMQVICDAGQILSQCRMILRPAS